MDYINEAFNGITIWATLLLPSLFPFFFFTRLFTSLNLTSEISKVFGKITKRLFNCSGESGYAFFMSIFSGYPVGSKLTADLYSKNIISSYEAKKMVSFTSNSGPMFILGTVGIGMLISKTAGLILLFSHIISAILNGIIFRGKKEVLHYSKKLVVLEEKK
ncbi:MAG: sporulation integral membrane protein YlbJ, partial [Clostridia bacterium]|nr:sporulation integral membrane protein YlbJ [Clostridia bacterium]